MPPGARRSGGTRNDFLRWVVPGRQPGWFSPGTAPVRPSFVPLRRPPGQVADRPRPAPAPGRAAVPCAGGSRARPSSACLSRLTRPLSAPARPRLPGVGPRPGRPARRPRRPVSRRRRASWTRRPSRPRRSSGLSVPPQPLTGSRRREYSTLCKELHRSGQGMAKVGAWVSPLPDVPAGFPPGVLSGYFRTGGRSAREILGCSAPVISPGPAGGDRRE